jgi:hypothetical protein
MTSLGRSIVLSDADIVLHAQSDPQALHAMVNRAWLMLRQQYEALGPDWTDADGEVHPRVWRVILGEAVSDRSLRQNAFYWSAVLPQIAAQAPGAWAVDAWHEAFKRTILGYEVVKAVVAGRKRPTVYRRLRSTKDLTVKQMSEYLDRVIADAVDAYGVQFRFDEQERQAVRYVRPKRAAKAVETPAMLEAA